MKTLKDFTPEIQAKIPEYIAKYTKGVFDGGRYNSFNKEDATNLINWNYETCSFKKPVVIVAENPYESQLFFNYIIANKKQLTPLIYINYCLINGIELTKELNIENSQLDSQLGSQLYSQLRSQLGSQLYSQLDSQLGSQLYSQLRSQLDSQLRSQLDSQLDSQLRSQLDSQLRSQLDSQLDSQLRSQLDKYNTDYLFTSNVYSLCYSAWYKFIKDEFNIDAQINVILDSWSELYDKSGVYSAIFSELVCVVSKYPKYIHRNENNDLHNLKGCAVDWGNSCDVSKFDCYYINGRNMPEWIFKKVKDNSLTKEEFINEQNEDIKAGIYELVEAKGEGSMLAFLGAKEVDNQTIVHSDGSLETLVLYKTEETFKEEEDLNGNNNVPLAWIKMTCPSTSTNYLIPTDSSFNNAVDAAKFARPAIVPNELDYSWIQRN